MLEANTPLWRESSIAEEEHQQCSQMGTHVTEYLGKCPWVSMLKERQCKPSSHFTHSSKPLGALLQGGLVELNCGGVLLSHTLSGAVPLAFVGLASGFGMFPGVSPLL